MHRARRKKLGNNTERAQFLSACGHAQAGIMPLQPVTINCHSLERGNPTYFPIFLLSKKTTKTRLTETFKKNIKKYKKIFQKRVDFLNRCDMLKT